MQHERGNDDFEATQFFSHVCLHAVLLKGTLGLAPSPGAPTQHRACAPALLPWLWILLMLHYSRRWREPDCPPALRMYLRRAALGCVIYTALFVTWVALFQTQWRNWGTFGTTMLIYVPPTTWWTDDNAT